MISSEIWYHSSVSTAVDSEILLVLTSVRLSFLVMEIDRLTSRDVELKWSSVPACGCTDPYSFVRYGGVSMSFNICCLSCPKLAQRQITHVPCLQR